MKIEHSPHPRVLCPEGVQKPLSVGLVWLAEEKYSLTHTVFERQAEPFSVIPNSQKNETQCFTDAGEMARSQCFTGRFSTDPWSDLKFMFFEA